MAKSYLRHPLSEKYPDISGRAWDDFLANLQARGQHGRKIVLHEGKVLDGWQLYRACQELGIVPEFKNLPKDEDPAAYVDQMNDHRRHESSEVQQQRANERRERVAAARAAGESVRTIAGKEGVSIGQVQRDLNKAGVSGDTPVLCERCKRIGTAVKNCAACAKARTPTKKGSKKKTGTSNKVDDFKNPVPNRCKDALFDPWIQRAIDSIGEMAALFWKGRFADALEKRKNFYPFLNIKDFKDGVAMAGATLDQLVEHLKEFRPAGVCPSCSGEGCSDCKMTGLVHRALYKELKK